MKYKLLPHQERVIEYANKFEYFIMNVAPGGGKSLITLHLADQMKMKLLVVLPTYLIENWKTEIAKFFDNKIVTVIRKEGQIYDLFDTDICLATYEKAEHFEKLFEWADFVAFEEGHYLKNMAAKRTQACHKLLYENSNKRMAILTGTPIKNRVRDFYSLLALCNYQPMYKKSHFLENYPEDISFAEKFSYRSESRISVFNATKGYMVEVPLIKYTGLRNVDELKIWMRPHYVKVVDTEFMKTEGYAFRDFHCGEPDDAELWEEFDISQDEINSVNPKVKVKAAMATSTFTVKYAMDLVESGIQKVVIYTDHVEPCEFIATKLKVPAITGKIKPEERVDIANKFAKDPSINYLVATIPSFSTGINQLVVSNNMILNDPCWDPGGLLQTIKRIDRIGQTKQCVIHRIMGTPQSEKIYEALFDKMETIKEAL